MQSGSTPVSAVVLPLVVVVVPAVVDVDDVVVVGSIVVPTVESIVVPAVEPSVVVMPSDSVPVAVPVPVDVESVEACVVAVVWVLFVVDPEASVVESSLEQPARESIRAEAMAAERKNIFDSWQRASLPKNNRRARSRTTDPTYDTVPWYGNRLARFDPHELRPQKLTMAASVQHKGEIWPNQRAAA